MFENRVLRRIFGPKRNEVTGEWRKLYNEELNDLYCWPGSVVGIATGYGLDGPGTESRWGRYFRTCPDRPWGPRSLLYNGYWVFPGGKEQPGRDADPSPPSNDVVVKG